MNSVKSPGFLLADEILTLVYEVCQTREGCSSKGLCSSVAALIQSRLGTWEEQYKALDKCGNLLCRIEDNERWNFEEVSELRDEVAAAITHAPDNDSQRLIACAAKLLASLKECAAIMPLGTKGRAESVENAFKIIAECEKGT